MTTLNGPLPASLAGTELAVQKALFEGSAHTYLQEFDQAEQKLAEAESLASSSHPRLLCQVMSAEGALASYKGNYAEAEKSYDQALKLAREYGRPDQEVIAQVGRAWVATHRQHFDEAVEIGKSALQLSRSLGMQSYAATTVGNLAWNYSQLGDFEAALDFYKQSAEESAKIGMSGYSTYWFSGVADAYMALREYRDAEVFAADALKHARELKNAQIATVCLNTLADIMLRTDRPADAQKYNQEALKMEETGEDKVDALDSWTMAGRIATAMGDFSAAEGFYQRVLADPGAGPELRWVCYAGLARGRDGQANYRDAERLLLKSIDTIEQARRSVNHDELRLSFLYSGIAIYGQYIDFLIRHGRPADAMHEAELNRARTLEEGLRSTAKSARVSASNLHPRQIAQGLKSTLLFYWLGYTHSYLWVITPAQTVCFTLPSESEINPAVKSYSEAVLGARDPLASANADGQKLYEMLVEPAEKLIPAKSSVIVLPDGSLNGLNFETLIVPGAKPHYWIEDVTLSTASSLTLLASAGGRSTPKERTLFLVGNTIPPNDNFPKLPQAQEEMKSVERYFPEGRTKVLSGIDATPSAYLGSNPERYSYLHFVTHGTASSVRPLESAVILSRGKDEDSYKLYAREIVSQRLTAYLVTISACNTSSGRTFSGEGLVGLSWAFLRAGAHNVIGALWEVSDTATPQLMDQLYHGLDDGEGPASALRAAKLSLLHSDSVFRKPRYWGPFQLYIGS
ncbi:MAG TPA: CHAT domain-containing protein [Candidatus Methylomirabilis sp.]|nr:CHAT domain-containing protein [Candidatus Methylomirabilis sp.]